MPRIDPITGVEVMTHLEFWEAEADREGKEVSEVITDFYQKWNDDISKQERMYMESLTHDDLYKMYIDYASDIGCDFFEVVQPFNTFIVEIVDLLDCKISQTFRETRERFVMYVKCVDGEHRIVILEIINWSGSFYEPPDWDFEIEVMECFCPLY